MREGLQRRQGLCLLRAPNSVVFWRGRPGLAEFLLAGGPLKKNARKELKAVKA
jgi:hypothetical protein